MEATQKKGFFKGKLAKSFSPFPKLRTTTSHQQCEAGSCGSSKAVPSSSPSSSTISNDSSAAVFMSQNSAKYSSSIPRVSTYSYANTKHPMTGFHEQRSVDLPSSMQKVSIENYDTWGHDDENIDLKAETFISIVRERFNLDRV